MTYGQLAKAAHRPGAARAVGSVMARNPIPIIIPCHRVVASGANRVGGFSAPGGSVLKQKLLAHEGLSQFTNRSPSLRG
jgi:methylated-DNA-[protein]-cysteine S-methyltransferase